MPDYPGTPNRPFRTATFLWKGKRVVLPSSWWDQIGGPPCRQVLRWIETPMQKHWTIVFLWVQLVIRSQYNQGKKNYTFYNYLLYVSSYLIIFSFSYNSTILFVIFVIGVLIDIWSISLHAFERARSSKFFLAEAALNLSPPFFGVQLERKILVTVERKG